MMDFRTTHVRPKSERLVDLHVYVVPLDAWDPKTNMAHNQAIGDAMSAGFVRSMPETTIYALRPEILRQLGQGIVPMNFIFLRSVGRALAAVKQQQEHQLKVKSYLPPQAYLPEIFVIEGDVDQLTSATNSLNVMSRAGSRGMLPPLTPPAGGVHAGRRIGSGNSYDSGISLRSGNSNDNNNVRLLPPNTSRRLDALVSPNLPRRRLSRIPVIQDRLSAGTMLSVAEGARRLSVSDADTYIGEDEDRDARYEERVTPTPHKAVAPARRNTTTLPKRPKQLNLQRQPAAAKGETGLEYNRMMSMLSPRHDTRGGGPQTTGRHNIQSHPGHLNVTSATSSIAVGGQQRWGEGGFQDKQRGTKFRPDSMDAHNKRFAARRNTKFGINFNNAQQQLGEAQEELVRTRDNRMEASRQDELLSRKSKALQDQATVMKSQTRDLWRKRYFDEKKNTPNVEERFNELLLEHGSLNAKAMAFLEGKDGRRPSKRNQQISSALRLQTELNSLKQKIEAAKIKLTTEVKLRFQAQQQLKTMRVELNHKRKLP